MCTYAVQLTLLSAGVQGEGGEVLLAALSGITSNEEARTHTCTGTAVWPCGLCRCSCTGGERSAVCVGAGDPVSGRGRGCYPRGRGSHACRRPRRQHRCPAQQRHCSAQCARQGLRHHTRGGRAGSLQGGGCPHRPHLRQLQAHCDARAGGRGGRCGAGVRRARGSAVGQGGHRSTAACTQRGAGGLVQCVGAGDTGDSHGAVQAGG